MNREEAIKWLKAIEKKYIHGGDEEYDNLRKIALHMAMGSLEQPEMKWVPVREGLPREYGLYLVTTCKNNVYLWTYKPEMAELWIHFISAWCYLPEPYEE